MLLRRANSPAFILGLKEIGGCFELARAMMGTKTLANLVIGGQKQLSYLVLIESDQSKVNRSGMAPQSGCALVELVVQGLNSFRPHRSECRHSAFTSSLMPRGGSSFPLSSWTAAWRVHYSCAAKRPLSGKNRISFVTMFWKHTLVKGRTAQAASASWYKRCDCGTTKRCLWNKQCLGMRHNADLTP